ncbi:unnamed protein product [Caenorhabditis angaria]|uniref:UDENN domain-containing protein n=1 Tax=Caenorhabditis angaria TaxID=860376 RepID=A0A9P1J460_9PELO|nr:unnamed protein product [Caenorhabditis angaria]
MTSSSRFREDVATIFDVFCEIGSILPGEKSGQLLTRYPEDYNDESILRSIQQFAFPCNMRSGENEAVQLFSFVLTDSASKYSFGFCRYTPRNDTCICLLSAFFWPNVFYKALNEISMVMNAGSQSDMDTILTRIYHTDIPNAGDVLRFSLPTSNHRFEAKIPDLTKLPTLREDKYMLEFYNAVSARQLIAIYSSMLKERRIIFTGKKLSQLSSCIHACSMLLTPMSWQSVFIPVLPASLDEMVMAPMPYLIGVPKQVLENSKLKDVGDIVIVDVDEKTLESPFDDVASMPNEVVSFLKSQLKSTTDMNDSFARIFLRANVILFGDYRSGFVRSENGDTHWDKDKFVENQKSSFQQFLSSLLGADGVQYLERFIHDRLDILKQGAAVCDEFELEIEHMDLKSRQNVNSEALQQAMQSVRDNASDVIGALKDKVSGIQLANKLNKLTPKEIRKAASKKKNGNVNPMSFDNVQWERMRSDESDTSPIDAPKSSEVPTANLIDFDSPVPNTSVNKWNEFLKPTNFQQPIPQPNVFTDPFSLLETPPNPSQPASSSFVPAQNGWEKFE